MSCCNSRLHSKAQPIWLNKSVQIYTSKDLSCSGVGDGSECLADFDSACSPTTSQHPVQQLAISLASVPPFTDLVHAQCPTHNHALHWLMDIRPERTASYLLVCAWLRSIFLSALRSPFRQQLRDQTTRTIQEKKKKTTAETEDKVSEEKLL